MRAWLEKFGINSRQDLEEKALAFCDDTRMWLQDHGELSLAVGLISGIILVLFFKIIFLFSLLGLLASYMVWYLSDPASSQGVSDLFSSASKLGLKKPLETANPGAANPETVTAVENSESFSDSKEADGKKAEGSQSSSLGDMNNGSSPAKDSDGSRQP